jgi:tetratricopeptide (TPR) repeat protein
MKTKTKLLHIILLVLLGVIVYLNSRQGEFVWDDYSSVKNNAYIRSWKLAPCVFTKDLVVAVFKQHNTYRPLETITYMIDYFFWKLNPQGYHLTNIFLHILTVLCLYEVIMLLFGNSSLALGTAALFLVHPVHVEVVSYISGRNDILALLFMLLSFIFYIKCTQARNPVFYLSAFLSYGLALLSKENALILPLLLLLYHYAFRKKINLLCFISVVSLAGIFVFLRLTLLKSALLKLSTIETVFDRLPGVFAALVDYLRLLFVPFNLHMDYGKLLFSWADPKVLLGVLIFLSLLLVGWRKRKTDTLVFFSIAWFFLAFLPVSNIYALPFYMAEHWLYVPSIGFFLFVVQRILSLSQTKKTKPYASLVHSRPENRTLQGADEQLSRSVFRFKKPRAFSPRSFIFIGLLCFYSLLTIHQNNYWRDPIAFYQRTLRFSPDKSGLYNNLGMVYEERGLTGEAVIAYQKAIECNPDSVQSYNNLGLLYSSLGRQAEAILLYKKAIRLNPLYPDSYNNLAVIDATLNKSGEAIELCRKAVELNPNYVSAYYNLGTIYLGLDRYGEAITVFQKVLELNPVYAKVYDKLGLAYHGLGRDDDAIAYLKKEIKLNPGYTSAYYNLASIYKEKKQYQEASALLEKASEVEPKNIDVLSALASLYRTLDQFPKASALYKKALGLDPHNPVLYFNLGNVCLALEQWHKAIDLYKKAIEINPQFAEAYDNLAVAYFHQRWYQLAVENTDKAAHLGVSNPELLEALKPYRGKSVPSEPVSNETKRSGHFVSE